MKKVFLSAIMMIAFVGTSMANTKEVNEAEKVEVEKTCEEKAMDYADGISGTDMEVYYAYTGYLDACNAANKPANLKKA